MRKTFLFLVTLISIMVGAQVPEWVDLSSRRLYYPQDAYFSGYALVEIKSNIDDAINRAKEMAQVEAISTIRVHVQNVTTSTSSSQQIYNMSGMMEEIYEALQSKTKITVNADIPGLKIETYRMNNEVAAFAYVKRRDLQRQLEKRIIFTLAKIETQLDNVDELLLNGQKMEARKKAEPIVNEFNMVHQDQELLSSVDKEADLESLQVRETKAFQQRYVKLLSQLRNGINIYLSCKADMFGQPYSAIASEIKGELSKMGCTFVTKPSDADWAIYVTANAREHNAPKYGEHTTYFTYTGATIAIDKIVTGQRIYENILQEKGSSTHNFVEAARDGYKGITPKVISIIKENIQQ